MSAKKLGIKTPMNLYDAKRIYPGLIVAPPDYSYYKKCSDEMMKLLKKKFSKFQQYSIDECFVECDEEMQEKYWDEIQVAYELKDFIKKAFWFTVNVWVGNNKFLAKMASDFEKPDKVHTLYLDEIEEKLWPLAIKDLFWCWRRTEPILKKMGIHFIGDLAKTDRNLLNARLWSYWKVLHDYANGIDESKVENSYDERKCIWASSITRVDTVDRDFILTFFDAFSEELAISLKDKDLAGQTITVHVRYDDYKHKSHQRKLINPINTVDEIYKEAISLFDEFWDKKAINLIGISISDLKKCRFKQEKLF